MQRQMIMGASYANVSRRVSMDLSDRDQLYVRAGRAGQVEQVGRVAGEDVIAILSEAEQGRVDDV
jgi:hypothetical protein